jgi:hypothetical protein
MAGLRVMFEQGMAAGDGNRLPGLACGLRLGWMQRLHQTFGLGLAR